MKVFDGFGWITNNVMAVFVAGWILPITHIEETGEGGLTYWNRKECTGFQFIEEPWLWIISGVWLQHSATDRAWHSWIQIIICALTMHDGTSPGINANCICHWKRQVWSKEWLQNRKLQIETVHVLLFPAVILVLDFEWDMCLRHYISYIQA